MRHQRRLAAGLLAVLLLANVASARRPLGLGGIGALGGSSVPKPVAWTIAPGRLGAQMSSCQMSEMTGQCKSTMAPVFQSGQPLIESTNYPAMAKAYIAANNWFCSQFSNDTCAWPCQYSLGIGCQIAGHLYYQPWTCPNSLGYAWNHCSQPPQWSSKPSCLSSSMCSWNDAADVQSAKCTSTYACNMTDQQKLFVYGSLYFSTMPRELHGCCKGSTYVYQVDNFCRAAFSNNGTGSATPESCAKVPGCTWDMYNVNGCYPSAQTQVALQFAYKPSDPLAAPLKQLAGECATIKDAAVCNNYKPVKVDPAKISYYVDKHLLLSLNQPVTDAICPLPSMPPPWV